MRRGAFSLICAVAAAFWVASCGMQDQPMAPERGSRPQLSRTLSSNALTTADRTPEVFSTGMILFETEAQRKEAEARYGRADLSQTPRPASERRFDVGGAKEVSGEPRPLLPPPDESQYWVAETWLNPKGAHYFYYGSKSYSTFVIDWIWVRHRLFCDGRQIGEGSEGRHDAHIAQVSGEYPDSPPDNHWEAWGDHEFWESEFPLYWYTTTYDELYH